MVPKVTWGHENMSRSIPCRLLRKFACMQECMHTCILTSSIGRHDQDQTPRVGVSSSGHHRVAGRVTLALWRPAPFPEARWKALSSRFHGPKRASSTGLTDGVPEAPRASTPRLRAGNAPSPESRRTKLEPQRPMVLIPANDLRLRPVAKDSVDRRLVRLGWIVTLGLAPNIVWWPHDNVSCSTH